MSVVSGRSPGSTLPPGNSHKPAIVLPSGRCAISTRLSASMSAQATTRVSLRVAMRRTRLRPVVAVDRDIFLGEVAGQYTVATLAESQAHLDLDLRVLHRFRNFGFVVGGVTRTASGDADAVEEDRQLVAIGGLAGL